VTDFLDTSTLIAALVESHPAHDRALLRLQGVTNGSVTGAISAHSLAETYAILTAMPTRPRITPATARHVIQHNILNHFEIIVLSESDYAAVIDHLFGLGITGGAIYDAVILHAASKANADQVVTLNERDFRRIRPDLADKIVAP